MNVRMIFVGICLSNTIFAMQLQQPAESFILSLQSVSSQDVAMVESQALLSVRSSQEGCSCYPLPCNALSYSMVLQSMAGSCEDCQRIVSINLPDDYVRFVVELLTYIYYEKIEYKEPISDQSIGNFIKEYTQNFRKISFVRVVSIILFFDIPIAFNACMAMQESFLPPRSSQEIITYNKHMHALAALAQSTAFFDPRYKMGVGSVALWKFFGSLLYPQCLQHPGMVEVLSKVTGATFKERLSPEQRKIFMHIERIILGAYSTQYPQLYCSIIDKYIGCKKNSAQLGKTIAYSPNGLLIATIPENENNIRLIDVSSGAVINNFIGHLGRINALTFDITSSKVISGADDGIVRIWGIDDSVIKVFVGHRGPVVAVACSEKGDYIASSSIDTTIRLWNLLTGQSRVLCGHDGPVTKIVFSPQGDQLVSQSDDGTIRLWDTVTGDCIKVLLAVSDKSNATRDRCITFSHDGSTIAALSSDTVISLWNAADGVLIKMLVGHGQSINTLCFGDKDTCLMSGSIDGEVRLWSILRGMSTVINPGSLAQQGGHVSTCSADMKLFVIGSPQGMLRIKQYRDNQIVDCPSVQLFDTIDFVGFVPDNSVLVIVLHNQIMQLRGSVNVYKALLQPLKRIENITPIETIEKASLVKQEDKETVSCRLCEWLKDAFLNWFTTIHMMS